MSAATAIPVLPGGVRLANDPLRGTAMLLGPERALALDSVAAAIIVVIDGKRDIAEIARSLAEAYQAPPATVEKDVIAFLDALAKRLLVDFRQ